MIKILKSLYLILLLTYFKLKTFKYKYHYALNLIKLIQ